MIELEESLPANVESEKTILGCILLDSSGMCLDQAMASLKIEDFTLDSHRRIYKSIVELAENGKSIDFITLTEQLGKHKEIEAVGGVVYVMSLTDGLPRIKNIQQYIDIIQEKTRYRNIIHLSSGAMRAAYEQSDTARNISAFLQDDLIKIEANFSKSKIVRAGERSDEAFAKLKHLRGATHELAGYSFGIHSLDFKTTGARKGELVIMGAKPGGGKTILAGHMIRANCSRNEAVGMFSVEMDIDSVWNRLWSAEAGLNFYKVRKPKFFTDAEWQYFEEVKERTKEWPLFIDESRNISISELIARGRLMIRQHKVGLILVDYIQIVDGPGKNEREIVSKITRALRILAGEGVAVVAFSQLSRPSERGLNQRPTMHSLKESGALESDADIVLLSYRPTDKQDNYTGEDELIIGKQRSGETGNIPVWLNGKYMRFEERALDVQN